MSSAFPNAGDSTVPLHTEKIAVSRREVAGDTVRVSIVGREQPRQVDEDLTHERVEIERVPVGRPVDAVPPIREEGDTTVISVVEEIVVVERRLILKEEVRIRRVRVTEHHRETVMVRDQNAVITRTEAGSRASQDDCLPSGVTPPSLSKE